MASRIGFSLFAFAAGDRAADIVVSLPGFEGISWDFKAYSGFIDVPGPVAGYDALKIHYQFHTSQGNPASDPVAAWHQGGPGGSSITTGLYGEMGALQVGEKGNYLNPFAWNKFANMLYLDSPAGVDSSQCLQAGQPVDCVWDDSSQAEAYAHTLKAFYDVFPEFAGNDLYFLGESYAGQYIPNIAHFIINTEPFRSQLPLKGIALGNACWGEHEDGHSSLTDGCNGPNAHRNDVEFWFGKGMISPKLYAQIQDVCGFPDVSDPACDTLLTELSRQVGPHNTYNVYDNCPQTESFLKRTGKDARWLVSFLRAGLHDPRGTRRTLLEMSGGFEWDCGGDAREWIGRADVRAALHLDANEPKASGFNYTRAGFSAVSLYPELAKAMRVLIFNGDADACVPLVGNEEWVGGLEDQGVLRESKAWSPWFTESSQAAPAGYLTEYAVEGSTQTFSFATVRLAGHMVPQFQPEAGFDLMSRWIRGGSEVERPDAARTTIV